MVPFERALVSSYKPSNTYYFCISNYLPEILDCSFGWGLRTPNFGEEEAVGSQGWYRSKERW